MMKNPITAQLEITRLEVEECRRKIGHYTRLLEIAQARLDAFDFASKAFDEASPKVKAGKVVKTRNRLPSADWQMVFQLLSNVYTDGFGYDEIYSTAIVCGVDAKKPSLRTKLMNYANDGYVERIDTGRFSITPKGRGYFKIGPNEGLKENGAAEAAPEAGEVCVTAPTNPIDQTPTWAQ